MILTFSPDILLDISRSHGMLLCMIRLSYSLLRRFRQRYNRTITHWFGDFGVQSRWYLSFIRKTTTSEPIRGLFILVMP